MKYYLIIIEKLIDETNPCVIYSYDTKDSVMSAYHSNLSSIYANENIIDFIVEVMDDNGSILYMEKRNN